MIDKKRQMSETIFVYMLLAMAGGAMDAYSYLSRGEVFANAQTGNILLFGVNLAEKNLNNSLRYMWPVVAFVMGIVISDIIRHLISNKYIHWRQINSNI